jgi:ribonuclease J
MQTKKLKIIPLGGLGEFGMNCLALRWEDDIIVIDAGLMFPESELARRGYRGSRYHLPH